MLGFGLLYKSSGLGLVGNTGTPWPARRNLAYASARPSCLFLKAAPNPKLLVWTCLLSKGRNDGPSTSPFWPGISCQRCSLVFANREQLGAKQPET